jgi:Leucine rich repeat
MQFHELFVGRRKQVVSVVRRSRFTIMTSFVLHLGYCCCGLLFLPLSVSDAECHVSNIRGERTADCSRRNLVEVPVASVADVRELRLADNRITSLGPDCFRSYGAALLKLSVARNDIDTIDDLAFRGLVRIKVQNNELYFSRSNVSLRK